MSKKHKTTKKKERPEDLIKVTLMFPASTSHENILMLSAEIKRLTTRSVLKHDPGTPYVIEVWCTPRQTFALDNFTRHMGMKQFSEGYDMEAIKKYHDEVTKDHPQDSFILPQDAQRLSIQAAATGLQNAILDDPAFREESEIEGIAAKICDLGEELWTELTNDFDLYRTIFIPSFITGYQIGIQQMTMADQNNRKEVNSFLIDQHVSGKGPQSLYVLAEMIKERMKATNATTVEELL